MREVSFLTLSPLPQGCHHPQEYVYMCLIGMFLCILEVRDPEGGTQQYLILLWEEPREPDFITAALARLGSISFFFFFGHITHDTFTGDSPLQVILPVQKSIKLCKPGARCESTLIYVTRKC